MNINDRLTLSFYETVHTLNEAHQIYIVSHRETGRIYVKKVLNIYNADIYFFLKEHPLPGIPKIYEVVENDNSLTIIEEYISGNTLEYMLETSGAFSEQFVINVVAQLCDILEELHTITPPIVHRDIKPSNIIFTPEGKVVLLDLNAAKFCTSDKGSDTILLGTRGYAAPEQYGFGASGTQTDIYAIGILMNTLLNGSYSPNITPGKFEKTIKKCTALDSSNRFSSVDSLKKSLCGTYSSFNRKKWTLYKHNPFYPPGFRTGSPWKMVIGVIGYLITAFLIKTFYVESVSPAELRFEQILCAIMFLSVIVISTNYLDVCSIFPFYRSNNPMLKVFSVVIGLILVLFLELFIGAILFSIIY